MNRQSNQLSTTVDPGLFAELPEPFWAPLREDIRRYREGEPPSRLSEAWTVMKSEGLWALFAYRLGRFLHTRKDQPAGWPVRAGHRLLWALYRCLEVWVSLLVDIRLDVTAQIAPGLYVGHFKSIYVGPRVRVGRGCNIGQMCWISEGGPEGPRGAPVLGDRVYVGVGAKVIGPVRVGNGAALGANAAVFADVPEDGVAVGNPATVKNRNGSADFVSLRTDRPPPRARAAGALPAG